MSSAGSLWLMRVPTGLVPDVLSKIEMLNLLKMSVTYYTCDSLEPYFFSRQPEREEYCNMAVNYETDYGYMQEFEQYLHRFIKESTQKITDLNKLLEVA